MPVLEKAEPTDLALQFAHICKYTYGQKAHWLLRSEGHIRRLQLPCHCFESSVLAFRQAYSDQCTRRLAGIAIGDCSNSSALCRWPVPRTAASLGMLVRAASARRHPFRRPPRTCGRR